MGFEDEKMKMERYKGVCDKARNRNRYDLLGYNIRMKNITLDAKYYYYLTILPIFSLIHSPALDTSIPSVYKDYRG